MRFKWKYKKLKTSDKRGKIQNTVSIHDRPELVNNRTGAGHWEIDTVCECSSHFVSHQKIPSIAFELHKINALRSLQWGEFSALLLLRNINSWLSVTFLRHTSKTNISSLEICSLLNKIQLFNRSCRYLYSKGILPQAINFQDTPVEFYKSPFDTQSVNFVYLSKILVKRHLKHILVLR